MNPVENGDKNGNVTVRCSQWSRTRFGSINQNLSRPKDAVLHAPSLPLHEQSGGDPEPALACDDERKSL